MHITTLRTFIAVSKTGGFHSAAERLNITQAAVSARIKTLEDQLGRSVFDRGRNGAALTTAGREFLPYAESITRTWDRAKNTLGTSASRPVQIRIGTQFSIWEQLILDWAAWIAESLPDTELELSFDYHSDMLKSIQNGKLDIAITHAFTPVQGIEFLPLTDETMVLVARRPASLNDDSAPPFVRMDWGPQVNNQIARIKTQLPKSKLFIGNGVLALQHILEHDACGYFPLRTTRRLLQKNRLYRVKRAPKLTITGHIIYNEDNPNRIFLERAIERSRRVLAV